MKRILNKYSIALYIILLANSCTIDSNPKKELFESTMESEYTFVCVVFMHQADTIIYCGDKRDLYNVLQPDMEESEFYIRCYHTYTNPISIDSIQLSLLRHTQSVIFINDSCRETLNHYTTNIREQEKFVLGSLNTNKPLSEDLLLGVYQCWLHNIIITTNDEVGPNYWFSYSLKP